MLLLDFFGTLVDYDPSRVPTTTPTTETFCREHGIEVSADAAVATWDAAFGDLDAETAVSMREYSMAEVGRVAFRTLLGREPAEALAVAGAEAYLDDWGRGILAIEGMGEALDRLGSDARLVIVSNTHASDLVQRTLRGLGVDGLVDAVVTSLDVGWRKPHPAIYEAALAAAGVDRSECLFVGDSKTNDYDGPRAAGIASMLVAPSSVVGVPDAHRIGSLVDLPGRVAV
ncbi:HAD family hydrolase [Frondihabitans australicus]|uniref:HAD family hydrolase n=1 Tax=Frondihabitans australicus TaxID=386892 RepID=UPI00147515B1|nr:HAD family hydrolase [Frondihabitans australicus]